MIVAHSCIAACQQQCWSGLSALPMSQPTAFRLHRLRVWPPRVTVRGIVCRSQNPFPCRQIPVNDTRRLNFEKCALTSGLLTAQQLEEARLALRNGGAPGTPGPAVAAPTDQELSEKIVEMGLLNAWQAKQLLDGRTKFNLGPYRIIDSLGQGGMGHVFKAEDPILKRVVAIKVLPRDKSTPEAIANFTREIQALSSLNHPKLVRAVDAGNDGNVNFLVTEYVPGSDLRKLVRRNGPLSMEAAANIISQVAEGLHHAHQQGIVHRDVKPGNVLVTPEGDAKLSDLGLAGPMYSSNADQDPRYGKIVGTADYLSPDHILSPWNPVPAWDIYSLGCTLYYAVTGKVPFPGGTTSDKARAHCSLKPLDPRRLNHQLSDAFVDVVADMMAKEPAQRVPSALAVIDRLAPWAREFQNQRQAVAPGGARIAADGGEAGRGIGHGDHADGAAGPAGATAAAAAAAARGSAVLGAGRSSAGHRPAHYGVAVGQLPGRRLSAADDRGPLARHFAGLARGP